MRIVEILLPKGQSDRSLSPQVAKKIDALQSRMTSYVDKIMDPRTSAQGKEFLKAKLRDDYMDMKNTLPKFHAVAEDLPPENVQYDVIDGQTGQKVGGPYVDRTRANRVVDRLDNKYGAYRYKTRPIAAALKEAVHKLPLSNEDFELVKKMMERPIPAAIAPIYISEFIVDDEFSNLMSELEESDPGIDMRPFIVEWFQRVMPDQMYRFKHDLPDAAQRKGVLSPIHGYDSHEYKGTNDPLTGNAYGSFM